jgi:flagellar hook protein FlgE
VSFVEVFGQTLRPGSGPTSALGGRNPSQLGGGAKLASIDRRMVQGSLLNTGRDLDLGIQGEGFFVVSDGNRQYYTRVGTFGIDAADNLVDLRSGFRVRNLADQDIQIDLNSVIQAQATANIGMEGNLPAVVTGPLAEVEKTDQAFEDHQPAIVAGNAGPYNLNGGETLLIQVNNGSTQTFTLPPPAVPGAMTAAEIAAALNQTLTDAVAVDNAGTLELRTVLTGSNRNIFISPTGTAAAAIFPANRIGVAIAGTETTANATTDLKDLSANTLDYQPGAQIRISGFRPDGTAVSGIFVYGNTPPQDGTSLGALVAKINSIYNAPTGGATAVLNPDGTITITADQTGAASLSISITDVTPAQGSTNWSTHAFKNLVQGADPDTAEFFSSIYDSAGQAHQATFTFTRQDDGSWDLVASVDPLEGTIVSSPITGISFDQNGVLNSIPPSPLQIQWTNLPGTQNINLDLGTAGQTDGITQFGLPASVFGRPDGYTAGALSSINVRSDGTIEGTYTNGRILDLDQIAIALFDNAAGLNDVGNGLFETGSNSGQPFLTSAESSFAGTILSGTLEGSNVDIAEEFVRLIEAERGFQANARMIRTTDDVLQELVNIV